MENKIKEKCKLTEKVDISEKIAKELTRRLFEVETELKKVNKKAKLYEIIINSKRGDFNNQASVTGQESTKSDTHDKGIDLEGVEAVTRKPKKKNFLK